MRTSAANRRRAAGFTLLEVLIAVAILALASLAAAAFLNMRAPRLAVERTADQLLVDLKRARLRVETTGAPATVEFAPKGYVIAAAEAVRALPRGVSVTWNGAQEGSFALSAGADLDAPIVEIVVAKNGARARIEVTRLTGRIARVE